MPLCLRLNVMFVGNSTLPVVPITTLYAAVLAFLFIALTVRVIGHRRARQVAIGTGNHADLERAARVHANFAEHVPLALILLLLTEMSGAARWIIHLAGGILLIGRLAHAFRVSRTPENFRFRTAGVAATLTVIAALATLLLVRMTLA